MNKVNCLVTVPAEDVNFKIALINATDAELAQALERLNALLSRGSTVKTRIYAVEQQIRKRARRNKN